MDFCIISLRLRAFYVVLISLLDIIFLIKSSLFWRIKILVIKGEKRMVVVCYELKIVRSIRSGLLIFAFLLSHSDSVKSSEVRISVRFRIRS